MLIGISGKIASNNLQNTIDRKTSGGSTNMEEEKVIDFFVPVTTILDIQPHPNAERLEIAKVFDFNVIVRKGSYKIGDTVIYAPIDSILVPELEAHIFGSDSKIKLNKGRIRQIRLRGLASQGMIINMGDVKEAFHELPTIGDNVADILKITKYEPPVASFHANQPKAKKERNRPWENAYFHSYNGLNNFKYYAQSDLFKEGQEVIYQTKVHGTNGRASLSPFIPKTFWHKVLKFFGKLPTHQFCYGSNNVQLQSKPYTGWYEDNLYAEAVKKYDIENKLSPNETVYFEIYGAGIQKNYMYDCKGDERKIVVFDVKRLSEDKQSNRWLSVDELEGWCMRNNLPMVPTVYRGPHSLEKAKECTLGDDFGGQKVREGIVIRDPNETVCFFGKKVFKLLSEAYLDDDSNTDFH